MAKIGATARSVDRPDPSGCGVRPPAADGRDRRGLASPEFASGPRRPMACRTRTKGRP